MAQSAGAHDEYRAALALRHTSGLGPRCWSRLADYFGSLASAAASARRWAALGLATGRQEAAFSSREWKAPAEEEYQAARKHGLHAVTLTSPDYPAQLRRIPDPPVLLYYSGRLELLQGPCLAVVGARSCSRYGLLTARSIGEEVSRAGITVVSGLADGIDRQAHLGGLAGVGSTVAVLGCGLDRVYPQANADLYRSVAGQGVIISELPPGSPPKASHFPVRNRIISGLSLGVWVVEAAKSSGSLITARLGVEQGREVFALPGRITDTSFKGCNALIADGAHPVSGAECILRELRYQFADALREAEARSESPPAPPTGEPGEAAPEPVPVLDGDEGVLMSLLEYDQGRHVDEVIRASGLPGHRVSALLVALEVRGLVRQWPGMYYTLAEHAG
ncbi:DNA-processing protein DprA [Desulfohalovibrio reitneri]|uniref:DNA-processing protein DprA n=1 Tax=Desulfohalovibrio reitneri TaxID=1307759 RepID=UPI000558D9C2|nr:DNA-processing protein DprA [Desulfohalovibrio reitneri]